MKLNPSKGNMYDFITHTGNAIKGKCPHGCTYCYMKKWGEQAPPHLDESELKGDIGSGKFIFIGSSCDMFAEAIPSDWINKVLQYCCQFDNQYLFQSKNPERFFDFGYPENTVFCTTIETNRFYGGIMKDSPHPENRAMSMLNLVGFKTYITIEPIMDFDLDILLSMVISCKPDQVNIGADSMGKKLAEPSKEKILSLIHQLEQFTTVKQKKNPKV